jgi:cell division protein FtsL
MDAMIISICFMFSKLLMAVYCFVITTAVGGANVQHRHYTYYVAGIKVYHHRIVY